MEVKAKRSGQRRGFQSPVATETLRGNEVLRQKGKGLGGCLVPPWGPTFFPLTFLESDQHLEVPALCCSKNQVVGKRGEAETLRWKGKERMEQSVWVPSWSLAASVLPKLPPAECHFAIYLHVIIAMRCRY